MRVGDELGVAEEGLEEKLQGTPAAARELAEPARVGCPLTVMRGADGAPQARRVGPNRWTVDRARIFFEHLSATCNVKFAADMAGMSHSGAYARRRTDPAFREAWVDAVESGYARLEAMLIARAGGTHDADALLAAARGDAPVEATAKAREPIGFDVGAHREVSEALDSGLALSLMASHRKVAHGQGPRRGGGKIQPAADPDDVAEAILKQLDALARRRQKAIT